jgi:hypothetical protein
MVKTQVHQAIDRVTQIDPYIVEQKHGLHIWLIICASYGTTGPYWVAVAYALFRWLKH